MGQTAKEMRQVVLTAIQAGLKDLVIDMAETTYMDSFSIGALVLFEKEMKTRNGRMVLRNINQNIMELFVDSDLDKIFTIASREGDMKTAAMDIFDTAVDIKLEIKEEVRNDICILHMSGVMNNPMGSKFFKQKVLLAMAHYKKILLNMEDLTFLDSMSVSTVIGINKLVKDTGGAIRVCGANYIIADLFKTLSLEKLFSLYATVDEAIAGW
jgi:anti-anti-sigma factor